LVVDDDRDVTEFLRQVLVQEEYAVLTAADGEEGLRAARRERPEVVLLDVLLPKMNGFEVCQRLRQDPATSFTPIMMLTSLGQAKDRLTGFKLGADDYMAKPVEPLELVTRVERLLEVARRNAAVNPLSGLPGPFALDNRMRRRLEAGEWKFSLALFDIVRFGDFNRAYGFDKGDGVIRLVGAILRSAALELGDRDDDVAHLGGDNFALLGSPVRAEVVASRVLEAAQELLPMQFDEAARRDGVSRGVTAEGLAVEGPLLSLCAGLVDNPPDGRHPAPLMDRARRALKEAQRSGGPQLAKG
jgi:PleD family two-component response regulator